LKKIICLGGVSGVGKTYRRTTDPELKDLPYVDIADIYSDNLNLTANVAFALMIDKLIVLLEDHNTVVLEAGFFPEGSQRQHVDYIAQQNDAQVKYIELAAPVDVCIQRVRDAFEKDLNDPTKDPIRVRRFHEARLSWLHDIKFTQELQQAPVR